MAAFLSLDVVREVRATAEAGCRVRVGFLFFGRVKHIRMPCIWRCLARARAIIENPNDGYVSKRSEGLPCYPVIAFGCRDILRSSGRTKCMIQTKRKHNQISAIFQRSNSHNISVVETLEKPRAEANRLCDAVKNCEPCLLS